MEFNNKIVKNKNGTTRTLSKINESWKQTGKSTPNNRKR